MKIKILLTTLAFVALTEGQPLPPAHPIEAPMDIYSVDKSNNVTRVPPASRSYTQLYAQIATYGALAGLDYHSTKRGLANHPQGREANPFLACGNGDLCVGRFVVLNAAAGVGVALIGRFVTPALPRTPRRIVNGMVWAMLGGRAVVVVRNYKTGGK